MSVNITVNGKFGRRCEQFSILDDVERKQKELEAENRKQRIRKTREQAKVVARKVREDVAEEKKRQERIMKEKEAREFCALQEQAIAQAQHNFRSSVFQIGEAHRAARLENEQRAAREREKAATYKQFKKQYKPRTNCSNVENHKNLPNIPKSSLNKTACTQTEQAEAASTKKTCPAEREVPEHPCRCCPCVLESDDDETLSETYCDISSSCSEEEDKDVTIVPSSKCTQTNKKSMLLSKTPAVVLEVDVDDNDIVTVTTPREVKDNFRESNRQFSTVVRVSPRKKSKSYESGVYQCEEAPISSESKTTTGTSSTSDSGNKRRFTQISDLIQKKSQTSTVTQSSAPGQKKSQTTTISQSSNPGAKKAQDTTTPQSTSVRQQSPRKQSESTIRQPSTSPSRKHVQQPSPKTTPKRLSRKESITTKNTETSSIQRSTVTLSSAATMESGSSHSGRVQFFDYKNKYTREYPQPVKAVQVQPNSQIQPTAMEQASIEKQLQSAREDEIQKMRQRSEERGQKALEREQVRRDCNELTEKLEALTKQHTHLIPSDTNILASHRYADAAARKEVKMNNVIEQILMRPAIITCKEVTQTTQPDVGRPSAPQIVPSTLNLGAPILRDHDNSTNSSDSCHSILLGYVNDQSQQIKHDLNQYETNPQKNEEKSKKLQNLLERINQLRDALLAELESGNQKSDVKNVQEVIDSISNLRQERERILIDCIGESKSNPLEDREKLLKQKEAILEKKVREFYKLQKNCRQPDQKGSNSSRGKPKESIHKVRTDGEKPLEIIIQVKGDCGSTKSKKIKVKSKSPRKLATIIPSPVKKNNKPVAKTKENPQVITRQNSYDSNSTSYRSLPPNITNKVDDVVDQVSKSKKTEDKVDQNSKECIIQSSESGDIEKKTTRLNPLVAHYVQRLLGMSRNSIKALGVSSSEIETPSSSIINTTNNVSGSESENLSTERINRVQKFINENHNLINELEESLRSQNNSNISLESSMKAFEEIWKQKLQEKDKNKQRIREKAYKQKQLEQNQCTQNANNSLHKVKTSNNKLKTVETQGLPARRESSTSGSSQQKLKTQLHKQAVSDNRMESQTSSGKLKEADSRHREDGSTQKLQSNSSVNKQTSAKDEKCIERNKSQSTSDAESQIVRYAQLTESCTHRIAELTELINKVREEKQKILENTLSSVSENGRNSTEYMELPDALLRARASAEHSHSEPSTSKILDSNIINEMPDSSTEMSRTENPPLEKHKFTGMSRDSGISMSRPVTAQEQLQDLDPQSLASSTGNSSMRKPKPPPSLSRFSPQLIEDELAHELSTILEVDTPATSRINTSVMPGNGATLSTSSKDKRQHPQAKCTFPTFEEYMQQINLDLTQVDAEKSIRVQHEFNELIAALGEGKCNSALNYDEFPSLTAYLQNLTLTNEGPDDGLHTLSETSPETIEDLLACLRLANLTIKSFPSKKEYMQKLATNTPERNLIESGSLENLTTDGHAGTDTESESINIEEELRRRNILRSSFRKTTHQQREEIFTSTAHHGMPDHTAYMRTLTAESGIEKLSTSDNQSGDLERELLRVGIKWPTAMRNKTKEAEALSSTTSTSYLNASSNRRKQPIAEPSPPPAPKPMGCRRRDSDNSANECGRPLNLRDFLTKELLMHANTSSSSSCDDSLRSQFFHSIIGSITPGCTPRQTYGSGGITLDRQKTSTPVVSQSTRSSSQHGSSSASTSTQLFSGESRLSSVHFHQSTSMRCQNDSSKNRRNLSDDKNHQ